MKYVVYDFETASRCDLVKRGAWVYSQDFSTFVITLAIKVIEDGRPKPTRVLTEADLIKIDKELFDLASDPSVMFVAHNAGFEQGMWEHHIVPMGYPSLGPERHHDTMAVAAMKGLPMGLDALGSALELPVRKDVEGHRLMLSMCKPDRHGGWSQHTPENLKRLAQYCGTDVDTQHSAHRVLGGLGPSERETWVLDQKINQRGILIDTEFVHACMDVLEQVRGPMTDRFVRLTGVKPTQREKFLDWVNAEGVPLGDMRKATLDAILDPDDEFGIEDFSEPLPYHVHEALTLRRALASSSVAKLERMLLCAGQDGRVRYTTQYHGARTGRHSGRLIQIQNYPRGELKDRAKNFKRPELNHDNLAEAILSRNVHTLGKLWCAHVSEDNPLWMLDLFSAVITSLRGCIVPEKGKVLVGGDFSQIEAKLLLSTAGQHDKTQMLASGIDAYAEFASMAYKKPINKDDHPRERQNGKGTVLGCLAATSLVLTHNGWKPIVKVLDTDLLWDGQDWVTHQGLVFKGLKETLNLSGLRLTVNHPVFTGERWLRANEVTEKDFQKALAFGKDHGPLSGTPTPRPARSQAMSLDAIARPLSSTWSNITSTPGVPHGVIAAPNERLLKLSRRSTGVTKISALISNIVRDFSTACLPYTLGARTLTLNTGNTMEGAEYPYIKNGFLSSWVGGVHRTTGNLGASSCAILCRYLDGIIQILKSTASTLTGTMRQAISGLRRVSKTWGTEEWFVNSSRNLTQPWPKSNGCEPVYDLANAGPRHRFCVMTSEGPIIVHNSGYGLGPVGYRARFMPEGSLDEAKLLINTYREQFAPLVPKFWYALYDASVQAVWCNEARTYDHAGIEFRREGDFLTMRLPSGRKIWYHKPRREEREDFNGVKRPGWSFMSYQGKKFRRTASWHGQLTADCIQGTARDLLIHAMKSCEREGLNTVFTVHDEIVLEEPERDGLDAVLKQIMEDIPSWARERKYLVSAETETMYRYRK